MTTPGRLLAAGREADIFDLGDGSVLRRYKQGGDPEHEALVMQHARAHGFPAPLVLERREGALVLERIDGPSMAEDLTRRPWQLRRHAETLASLHTALHAIDAPDGLAAAGRGRALLHLDLHPLNVLLTARGPIVIDWTNARRGEPALDVALTWVIIAPGELPSRLLAPLRDAYVRSFLSHFDRGEIEAALPAACERRLVDPNLRTGEGDAVRRLAAAVAARSEPRPADKGSAG